MITLDRDASTPIQEQLAEQLRYALASGRIGTGERLPSTRGLGDELGISFHTVRKAYQQLESEGWVEARRGSGYHILERPTLPKAERLERGAEALGEAIRKLVGLGLSASEIEYLVAEQTGELVGTQAPLKLVAAAPFRELATALADALSRTLQQPVEAADLGHIGEAHPDADFVFARSAELRTAARQVPHADALGLVVYLHPAGLARAARLLPTETLALITRHADALPHLMAELRHATGFAGQVIGASLDEGTRHLPQFLQRAQAVVYTQGCARRLTDLLAGFEGPADLIRHVVSAEALEMARAAVPD